MAPRIGVITFPGTLEESEAARAITLAGGEPVALWHDDVDLSGVDAIVLPGGAAHGNYLRPGALAALAPIVSALREAADAGTPILGIANGFQILTEAGILPGSLITNDKIAFLCTEQSVTIENASTAWTGEFTTGEAIPLPFKSAHGQYVATEAELDELEAAGRVVLRYAGSNPTGSARSIAGVSNAAGNVVGVMVSPEHATEAGFGPDSAEGHRSGTDGLRFFASLIGALAAA